MPPLTIESVRARLTIFYVGVLAVALVIVGGLIYVLLARALYTRVDDNLHALIQITGNSLQNDLAEGQDVADAARSTAAELASFGQMLAIYDEGGRLLAEEGRDDDIEVSLPLDDIVFDETLLMTIVEPRDADDRHRLAMRRLAIPSFGVTYVLVAGSSLEPTDEELEALGEILILVVPLALALAGLGTWFLARKSLSPVVAMADRARRMGAEDLSARLPVVNPRDELGKLAETFNELLARLEASLTQQRQFMADASHELRTPVTTARTAANVALQQRHREEADYRETLALIEQQTARLSRIVEDMFTLARADAGSYPVQRNALYLDEVVEEVVKATRVLASMKRVQVECTTVPSAAMTGDEELMRRLVSNLLDNAVRYSPPDTVVRIDLTAAGDGYEIAIKDSGPGIPPESQPHIFERFYRADSSRWRDPPDTGAGLGLALVRWIASVHHGSVRLTETSSTGSTFTVFIPAS